MPLFQINYNKPGPGIEKDAPPQKAVPRFFSILGRKFFDLIKLNLLFCIPVAIAFLLAFLLSGLGSSSYLTYLPFILVFPFLAGLTIVTRNYAREEHAFIFHDFMKAVKGNWKAFLANGVVCYLLIFILSFSIRYYASKASENTVYLIFMALCFVVAALLTFSQYYVPVMLVTFDLKLIQVYKNALIFAIVGLWRNLLLTAILAVIFVGLYLLQILAVFLIVFLIFAFCMFLINFAVYPLVDKIMIRPYLKEHPAEPDSPMGKEDK